MIVILRLTPQSRACCPPGGRRRTLALLIGIALFTVSGHALADYAAGAAFYAKKDYEHAFDVLLPAAQEGEAEAQFTMGVMYDVGQHVQVDKQAAFGWYRQAADQGHPNAQIRLSGMLFAGEGVAPDRQEAYKWALLAIDRLPVKKRDGARAFSKQIRPLLDDAQAAHAQAEAEVWQPRLPAMADHDGATPRLIKTGTGVFMNERGSLLTDLHVAWPCRRLLVSYGDATNEATIFTFDIALDLAGDTAFRRVQTAVFAVAPSLSLGESVSIIGYALQETSSRAPISAQGTITALGLFGNEDFFWTSASSRQGQSGGPVIDERGLVVGLLKGSSKTQDPAIEASSSTQNRSLAIAGERIAGFLERSKIAFRKSTSDGAIGETHSTASRAGIIGSVECWG
jgi:S1-C subfamily serine protease